MGASGHTAGRLGKEQRRACTRSLFFSISGRLGYNKNVKTRQGVGCVKIAIGADHGGFALKEGIKKFVKELGHEVEDLGCDCADSVDYPDYALPVCEKVVSGDADKGILICGTGIGMTIAANKIPGIRCALVHDIFSAKATREHNDSNVLAMGERVIGPGVAEEIVRVWLGTEFSHGARHEKRLGKVKELEEKYTIHP
jgi:ribose 5-phosphate isomerase B